MSGTHTPSVDGRPSRTLRVMGAASRGYARFFAASPVAPVLSRPHPVRHTGYDIDVRVAEVRPEAEDAVSLRFERLDGTLLPRWIPGAHLDVFLPSGRQRQYSLNSDPGDLSDYRIAVRRIAAGAGGSREIHDDVRAGDVIRIRGPRNAFHFVEAASYLFIAGGIGVTPILPMVRAAAAGSVPWRMVYVGRSRVSMPFLDELQALGGDAVEVRADDEVGNPDIPALLATAAPGAAIYLCGPPPLQSAALASISEVNPTCSLHTERFSAPPVIGGEPFEVQLRRSGGTVQVAGDESTLAAVRRGVPGVAYSCQQGFCGTCKVKVLSGKVAHHDVLLTDAEREDNMLICVSRAAGDQLVIDL